MYYPNFKRSCQDRVIRVMYICVIGRCCVELVMGPIYIYKYISCTCMELSLFLFDVLGYETNFLNTMMIFIFMFDTKQILNTMVI